MSRSEFSARAAHRGLEQLDARSLSSEIDHALQGRDATDETQASAVAVGRRVLDAVDDRW